MFLNTKKESEEKNLQTIPKNETNIPMPEHSNDNDTVIDSDDESFPIKAMQKLFDEREKRDAGKKSALSESFQKENRLIAASNAEEAGKEAVDHAITLADEYMKKIKDGTFPVHKKPIE